jgi:hypothetical protein
LPEFVCAENLYGEGRAFRHETTHATQMIEVVVGVDEVADRLARKELVHFGNRRTFIAGIGSAAAWPVVARAQRQAAVRSLRERRDGALNLAGIAYIDGAQFHLQERGRGLDGGELAEPGGAGGVPKHSRARHRGRDLLEQFELSTSRPPQPALNCSRS